MKSRIGLFLNAKPFSGGTFQYSQAVLEAVSSLPKDRFDVTVAYTTDFWNPHVRELEIPAFPVRLGAWKFLSSKRLCEYLPMNWWRIHRPSFSVVIKKFLQQRCHLWIFPAQDTWTYVLPLPSLGVIFDLMHRYERRFAEASGYGLYKCREKHYSNICRFARGVFVDSEIGRQHVIESYAMDPDRIHVLPFVPPKYICSSQNSEGFLNRYHLPQKYIFYPAQFWEHKNHKSLVNAAAVLKDELPELSLVFVGSKKNGYDSTYALVREMGLAKNVHFLGYVSDADMPELYRRARALVMPTFFGPTNIPPLEAMAVGCPVAASRIYGMPEQLGDAALFFDPRSVEDIAQTMKVLWNDDDLCAKLSRRGLMQSSRWNQTHFNQRLQEIIERVLKGEWKTP